MDVRWLDTLEEEAECALPAAVFRYVRQGARDGVTAAEARAAWAAYRFAPHVLRDVTEVDTSAMVLGRRIEAPIAIAPTTMQRAIHPDGELAMARATAEAGSLMVVSSNAGTRFADIAATGVHWWLQAYVTQDRSLSLPVIMAAVEAGASAIVLTVDTPVVGTKCDGEGPTVWDEAAAATLRVNFPRGHEQQAGAAKAMDLSAADIAWLGEVTGLPVVVKGVLRPDDARRCVQAGAAAVWVSNHGGRQLDRALSTAAALPAVVSSLDDKTEVYVDGGVRTGSDVLAALGLGARCAFLGRLPLWALVNGATGVSRMHVELAAELVESMRLVGAPNLAATRQILAPGSPF